MEKPRSLDRSHSPPSRRHRSRHLTVCRPTSDAIRFAKPSTFRRDASLTLGRNRPTLIGWPTFPNNLAREEMMEAVNRRTTLALGLTTAATPLIAWATPAAAQTYGPDEGEEIAPGVRVVTLGERPSV